MFRYILFHINFVKIGSTQLHRINRRTNGMRVDAHHYFFSSSPITLHKTFQTSLCLMNFWKCFFPLFNMLHLLDHYSVEHKIKMK